MVFPTLSLIQSLMWSQILVYPFSILLFSISWKLLKSKDKVGQEVWFSISNVISHVFSLGVIFCCAALVMDIWINIKSTPLMAGQLIFTAALLSLPISFLKYIFFSEAKDKIAFYLASSQLTLRIVVATLIIILSQDSLSLFGLYLIITLDTLISWNFNPVMIRFHQLYWKNGDVIISTTTGMKYKVQNTFIVRGSHSGDSLLDSWNLELLNDDGTLTGKQSWIENVDSSRKSFNRVSS